MTESPRKATTDKVRNLIDELSRQHLQAGPPLTKGATVVANARAELIESLVVAMDKFSNTVIEYQERVISEYEDSLRVSQRLLQELE